MAHYDRAGVTQFFIALAEGHGSAVRPFMRAYRITTCEELRIADRYPFGVNAATKMRRRYQDPDEWVVMVDLDEFVEFPKPVFDIIADAQKEGPTSFRRLCTIALVQMANPIASTPHRTYQHFSPSKLDL